MILAMFFHSPVPPPYVSVLVFQVYNRKHLAEHLWPYWSAAQMNPKRAKKEKP